MELNYNDPILQYLEEQKKKYSHEVFEEKPVSFATFCEKFLKQPLPPVKREIAEKIFGNNPLEWNTQVQEIYLLAGKGGGKDFLITRLLTYIGYWLLCLNNPQQYFGLADGTPIEFANVSINSTQAKEVFFKEFTNVVRRTINPKTGENWFAEHGMDLREEMDIQTRKIIFSLPNKKNIQAYSLDSEKYTGEGKNLLVVIFDEAGAFRFEKAEALYDSLRSTEISRFRKFRKLIMISYKYDDDDFMMTKWKSIKKKHLMLKEQGKEIKDGILLLGPYATWELNPNVTKEDFLDEYDKNPEKAKRIYECRGSSSVSKYFNYQMVVKHLNHKRISPIMGNPLTIRDPLNIRFHSWFRGGWIYELEIEKNPEVRNELINLHYSPHYHIHIDLSKGKEGGDCAGFCLAHSIPVNEDSVAIYIDLMMQLKGKGNIPINFEDIRQLIFYLSNRLNFNIKLISLDGYQSEDFMQIMQRRGYEVKLVSVDRTVSPYETLQDLLYQGRVDFYEYPVFLREIKELEESKGKIDHPERSLLRAVQEGDERGSKDVSDAVAGCVYTLITEVSPRVSFMILGDEDEEDE